MRHTSSDYTFHILLRPLHGHDIRYSPGYYNAFSTAPVQMRIADLTGTSMLTCFVAFNIRLMRMVLKGDH